MATLGAEPSPDWRRLQEALSVEAETGFSDLVGKRQRFSEFIHQHFQESPRQLPLDWQESWRSRAASFQFYPDLTLPQRQHLVADTRRFLYQARQSVEAASTNQQQSNSPAPTARHSQPPAPRVKENLTLGQSLTQVAGIGDRDADRLAKLGLHRVRDLLYHYPRDHLDYTRQVPISALEPGETVTIVGRVRRCSCFSSPRNAKLTILELWLRDNSSQIKLNRFFAGNRYANRGWQEKQRRLYPPGAIVAASGLVKQSKYGLTLDSPELEVLEHEESSLASFKLGRLVPIYPLTEGVAADLVRRAIAQVLPMARDLLDPLPQSLRQSHGLIPVSEAIAQIHFPADQSHLEQAKRRLIFDEFFYLQLGLLQRRHQQQAQTTAVLTPTGVLIDAFYRLLPFEMTKAQQRVVNEILADLQQPKPMNRLVQGDVGSGKTVVAVVALLAAIQAGYQGALMSPTEVLADQHYRKLVSWLNLLHLPVELLTGSTRAAKRRQILQHLETGELPVLVGTHALIQDRVNFQNLGLVVIDEQHRFGVEQRARLQHKGNHPHVLSMTATPIPRTLALTLHGDLEISQIDELPPGRQPIQTTILAGGDRLRAYELVRREVVQGRQAYVVLPLVEESEKVDLRSVLEEHQRLQEVFPEFNVGLLHGRMTSVEKEAAVAQFQSNDTQILVSTTVVEVGVDVPNATVMLIEHGERFGLSQLHQLRGRVGRGSARSYCLLMNNSKNEAAQQRLRILEQSQDGFFIADMDLRLRGPGAVLGTRQSGLPDFALASLIHDQAVLDLAREAAGTIMAEDSTLERWPALQQELHQRHQKLMGGAILT